MTFAERLKKLRNEKGWSQDNLGKKANIHIRQIGKYEAGDMFQTSEPLIKLSKAFGCINRLFITG